MMAETLTLEQVQQLAKSSKSNFNPFGENSFEGLIEDAKKRMADEAITTTYTVKERKNVRLQRKWEMGLPC